MNNRDHLIIDHFILTLQITSDRKSQLSQHIETRRHETNVRHLKENITLKNSGSQENL